MSAHSKITKLASGHFQQGYGVPGSGHLTFSLAPFFHVDLAQRLANPAIL
jgi:hypothetical protein